MANDLLGLYGIGDGRSPLQMILRSVRTRGALGLEYGRISSTDTTKSSKALARSGVGGARADSPTKLTAEVFESLDWPLIVGKRSFASRNLVEDTTHGKDIRLLIESGVNFTQYRRFIHKGTLSSDTPTFH